MKKLIAVGMLLLPFTSHAGVKVGDIDFSYEEVCSKEYTGKRYGFDTLGCLPPQRFVETQKYYFTKLRPPIGETEVKEINDKAQKIEVENVSATGTSASNTDSNVAPSFIGRIFPFGEEFEEDRTKEVPADGQLTIPPLDYDITKLPTKVMLSTELGGASSSQRKMGLKIDVDGLVTTVLAQNPQLIKTKEILTKALKDVTASYEASQEATQSSLGKFQYVSIKSDVLDGIIQGLSDRCLIVTNVEKAKSTGASKEHSYSCKTSQTPFSKDYNGFNTDDYLNALVKRMDQNNNNNLFGHSASYYGLIIGAAIINTSGLSSKCTATSASISNTTFDPGKIFSCDDLAARINAKIEEKKKQADESNPAEPASEAQKELVKMTSNEKEEVSKALAAAYISSKNSVLKNLKLDGHSTILSIQYIRISPPRIAP
jgi:hypothetical protein